LPITGVFPKSKRKDGVLVAKVEETGMSWMTKSWTPLHEEAIIPSSHCFDCEMVTCGGVDLVEKDIP
jgi:hypothetical protein